MQNNSYSIEEIRSHIEFHQNYADKYLLLFNSNLSNVSIMVATNSKEYLGKVLIKDAHVSDIFKNFLQQMCEFHVKERIKWEILFEQTNDITVKDVSI